MNSWNPAKAIKKPLNGLCFIEFHKGINFLQLAFHAKFIKVLEIPFLESRYPDIESAPELKKYCRATKGMKICLNHMANSKYNCLVGRNGLELDLSQPFTNFLGCDSIRLICDRTYDNDFYGNFIEINPMCLPEYIDGYGDLRGNHLQETWIDEAGDFHLEGVPLTKECMKKFPPPEGCEWDIEEYRK